MKLSPIIVSCVVEQNLFSLKGLGHLPQGPSTYCECSDKPSSHRGYTTVQQ